MGKLFARFKTQMLKFDKYDLRRRLLDRSRLRQPWRLGREQGRHDRPEQRGADQLLPVQERRPWPQQVIHKASTIIQARINASPQLLLGGDTVDEGTGPGVVIKQTTR